MRKILLLGDLHCSLGAPLYEWDVWERLRACFAHMRRNHPDASCLVLLGDLAHEAEPAVYERLALEAAELDMPVAAVPGNHDDADAMACIFPAASPEEGLLQGIFLPQVLTFPECRLLFAHSSRKGRDYGFLDGEDAARLKRALREAQDGAGCGNILLFLHHPPLKSGIPVMDSLRLTESAVLYEAAQAVNALKGPRLVLICGHLHRTVMGLWHGLPVITARGIMPEVSFSQPKGVNGIVGRDTPPSYGVLLLDVEKNGEPFCMAVHEEFFLEEASDFLL